MHLTLVPLAYLAGALPFSYLIVRLLRGVDIRTVGSGNAGATNVLRAAGRGPALLALVLDACKGAAMVLLARALGSAPPLVAAVAVAAVVGHVYPVFLGFRGGKGVATAAGTLGALVPWATAVALLVFVLLVAATRYVSLGSVVAAVLFPLLLVAGRVSGCLAAEAFPALLAAAFAIAALVLWKHRDNLRRLRAGTESKLGAPRPASGSGA